MLLDYCKLTGVLYKQLFLFLYLPPKLHKILKFNNIHRKQGAFNPSTVMIIYLLFLLKLIHVHQAVNTVHTIFEKTLTISIINFYSHYFHKTHILNALLISKL